MPEQLLTVLKLCLLALLYLFFLRVIRAVWAEVDGPKLRPVSDRKNRRDANKRARAARGRKGGGPGLKVLEPPELKGNLIALEGELTLGRAAGCEITLDDTYASQMHARVYSKEDAWYVEDLGSTNGTYLNRNRVTGPMLLKPGDLIQIGSTVVEMA